LYLRPFYQEATFGDLAMAQLRRDLLQDIRTSEAFLDDVFDDIGPFIAVGQWGEQLPSRAAIRLFFPGSEWRDMVSQLMSLSRLVIIQAGRGKDGGSGLEWEMATAKKLLQPHQLVFSFCNWHRQPLESRIHQYQAFRTQFSQAFGMRLPVEADDAYFLYFAEAWEPKLAHIRGWKRYVLKGHTEPAIRTALEPILEAHGLVLKRKWGILPHNAQRIEQVAPQDSQN